MYLKDGDEKDEEDDEGRAKDKIISLFLKSQEEESNDKCFVHLEVSVYSWINSVAQAPPGLFLAMFQTEMVEAGEGVLVVKGMSGESMELEQLLKHIYTGTVDKLDDLKVDVVL
jgi:hypothetical protein